MSYILKDQAKETLSELDRDKAGQILDVIQDFSEKGLDHSNVKLIKDRRGEWLYRIKIVSENCNHRAFIDYIDGRIEVLDILHRDVAYEGKFGNRN